jgi:hypothetical protein
LVTITATHKPGNGFGLPAPEESGHLFCSEATPARCTAALLLHSGGSFSSIDFPATQGLGSDEIETVFVVAVKALCRMWSLPKFRFLSAC